MSKVSKFITKKLLQHFKIINPLWSIFKNLIKKLIEFLKPFKLYVTLTLKFRNYNFQLIKSKLINKVVVCGNLW